MNHPNILAVYDVGTHDDAPYIVSELLEGEELREQLSEGSLPQRKALDYAQQIAQGLAAAHERGITHRDLKPENLFVTTDGRVKILDFGLAKLSEPPAVAGGLNSEAATRRPLTDPGTVMGTVGYMSPEQVRGHEADHRSDIFSFGSILYEMLAGQRAFRRDTMAETMTAILKEEPPELSETNAKISLPLEKIVRRCLEKKPEGRFHSASDLAFALESCHALGIVGHRSRQDLDGDLAPQPAVARAVHLAHPARAERGDDFVRPQMCSRFQDHRYFPVGTRRFRSSNQFNTTLICVAAGSCSLALIIRKR